MLFRTGISLCYVPVLGKVAVLHSLCISVRIFRSAGRLFSACIYTSILICFAGLKFYLSFVLFCLSAVCSMRKGAGCFGLQIER